MYSRPLKRAICLLTFLCVYRGGGGGREGGSGVVEGQGAHSICVRGNGLLVTLQL